MSKSPLISVIIPTFNSEKFLEAALSSALEQTYSNIEVIVVDDGSEDNSCQIVESFAARDGRVKLLKMEHTGNVGRNSNNAIKTSNGQYIAKLDSDDVWRKDKLDAQLMQIESYKLICSDAREIDENENLLSSCYHCLGQDKDLDLPFLLQNKVNLQNFYGCIL